MCLNRGVDTPRSPGFSHSLGGADAPAVAAVVCDGVTAFELGVTSEVFGPTWGPILGVPWYRLTVCALDPGPVTAL